MKQKKKIKVYAGRIAVPVWFTFVCEASVPDRSREFFSMLILDFPFGGRKI